MQCIGIAPITSLLLLSVTPAAAVEKLTDVNLVTAIDVSGSVDGHAERLELLGMADALEHPAVLQAIASGPRRRIGFTVFTWSSAGNAFLELVPWTVIASPEDAARAAHALRAAHNLPPQFYARPWRSAQRRPWVPGLATDISATIEHGIELLQAAPFATARRVINVCANGQDNVGIGPEPARDRAAAGGIGLNAVVRARRGEQARNFGEHVRIGPHAFVIQARVLTALTQAMLRKIDTEIAGRRPEP
jgi:hypothetical protein